MSGRSVEITLTKAGRTKIRYPAEVLAEEGARLSVRAPWAAEGVRDFGFVRFEPGDVFVEHYWSDRWFTVKEVWAADGVLKGWYCDITRPPVIGGSGVVVEDLDLDLWVSADGSEVLRLDEDEFEASGLAASHPEAAARAVAALDELEALGRKGLVELLGQRSSTSACSAAR
ncbi:DUF402 domain-containing protein [Streptomyces sp. NPDC059082]|uniref:DUF402 domain-containing protein n=1 Tax=Streptomyces sp. NPDC059082 TaxID=3346720 RepID=UPI0036C40EC9